MGLLTEITAEFLRLEAERKTLVHKAAVNDNWPAMYRMYQELVGTEKDGRRHAEALVKQLVAALEWYANTETWRPGEFISTTGSHRASAGERDAGMKARDALAAARKEHEWLETS